MKYRALLFGTLAVVFVFLFGISITYVVGQIEESHMMTAKLHLITAIEFIEHDVDSFFKNESIRVSDWSSDGNIRDTTDKIVSGTMSLGVTLGDYIRTKKMPLDTFVLNTEVIDEQGHLLVSTAKEENMPMHMETNHLSGFDPAVISGLKFGDHAFSLPILESHTNVSEQLMIHFIAPLFSLRDPSRRVGFLIIHIRLDSFFAGLSSENIKTTFGNPKLYLFDKSGTIYLPTKDANISTEEMSTLLASCKTSDQKEEGFIREFLEPDGRKTIGAIICAEDGWWITYLAANESAIMSKFLQGRNNIILTLGLFFFCMILVYAIIELDTSRKIRAIAQVLGEVSKGNLKSRVAIRSGFFSEIVQSINSTVAALEKTSQEEGELEKLYRTLTDSSPISITLLDQNGRVIFLNKYARKELGVAADDDLSRFDMYERIDPRDRALLKEKIESTLRDGTQHELEFRHIPGHGNEYCNGFLAPVRDEGGVGTGIIFSSVDVTDRKKAEERVGSLEKVKNEFISIAAHQIRAPLTTILGASDELQTASNAFPEKERELTRVIKESVIKLNDFITFLLSATRSESGATKFHLTSFDLKALTEEVIETLRASIEEKKVAIEIGVVPDPLPHVYTDREVVRQVIQNFISNAIRYSHREGKVSVQMKLTGGSIEYMVKDDGIGIPASAHDRIFTKFFRADNAKKQSPDGIGLGLSFSKSLVESWGGEVWFESEEGKGASFHITIPIIGTEKSKSQILT